MTHTVTKKVGVTGYKTPSVNDVFCRECPDSEIHSTGSLLWVSCRFQDGWRSINAVCNLPENQKQGVNILRTIKKCKEKRQKQKVDLRRKRLIRFRNRKHEKIINSKFVLITLPEFLDQKINTHIFEFGYPSKSAFIRDAIDEQLRLYEKIFCNSPKKRTVRCVVTLSGQTFKEMYNSTAISNYSSISDFVRHAIKNQIKWDVKYDDIFNKKC